VNRIVSIRVGWCAQTQNALNDTWNHLKAALIRRNTQIINDFFNINDTATLRLEEIKQLNLILVIKGDSEALEHFLEKLERDFGLIVFKGLNKF